MASTDDIRDVLAAAADDAENNPDAPIPAHSKVSRGHGRTRVLQVRLNAEELQELERVAASRGLPTSTVARDALLRYLHPQAASATDAERLVDDFARFVASLQQQARSSL